MTTMAMHPQSLKLWSNTTRQVAEELDAKFSRADWTSTYPGHGDDGADWAIDLMCQKDIGDRIAEYAWANRERLGIWYIIWNRRIISQTRPSAGWQPYWDGWNSNPSKAHTNHVHISRYPGRSYTPPAGSKPASESPAPKPKPVKPQRGAVGTTTKTVPARTVPGGKFVRIKGKIPRRRKGYRLKIGGVRRKDGVTWVTGVNRGWWHNAAAFDFHLPARKKLARPVKGAVAVADKSVPARSIPGGKFVRIKNKIPRRRKGYKLWVGGVRKTKDGTVWITGPNGGWWHNADAFTYYSR